VSERLLDLLDPLPEQLPSEGGRFPQREVPQKRYSGRSIQEIADAARAALVARARFLKDMAPEEQARLVAELKDREAARAADPNRQRALELERAAQRSRKRRCRRG
jgi:hypothetical protein